MSRTVQIASALLFFVASGASAQTLRFAPTPDVVPGVTRPYDGKPVDPERTYLRTIVRSDQGTEEQYVQVKGLYYDLEARSDKRLSDGVALAASIDVPRPNPGDRFAFSIGSASSEGRAAGSIAASGRLGDKVLAYAGYAKSETRSLLKGGFSVSIK